MVCTLKASRDRWKIWNRIQIWEGCTHESPRAGAVELHSVVRDSVVRDASLLASSRRDVQSVAEAVLHPRNFHDELDWNGEDRVSSGSPAVITYLA
jgi:hypothetical protein